MKKLIMILSLLSFAFVASAADEAAAPKKDDAATAQVAKKGKKAKKDGDATATEGKKKKKGKKADAPAAE